MFFSSDLEQVNAFCKIAMLDQKYDPWVRRRKPGLTYGNILITSPGFDWGERGHCWWRDYVGLEVFCQLKFETCRWTGKTILKEAHPVRLTNTRMNHGRGIPATAFALI